MILLISITLLIVLIFVIVKISAKMGEYGSEYQEGISYEAFVQARSTQKIRVKKVKKRGTRHHNKYYFCEYEYYWNNEHHLTEVCGGRNSHFEPYMNLQVNPRTGNYIYNLTSKR